MTNPEQIFTGPELHDVTNKIMRNILEDYGRRPMTWEELPTRQKQVYNALARYLNERVERLPLYRRPAALPELHRELFNPMGERVIYEKRKI